MTAADTTYQTALSTYNTNKLNYDAAYALYEPYANGITAARTRFANEFISGTKRDPENAWNVLYLSQDNPTIRAAPSAPSLQ